MSTDVRLTLASALAVLLTSAALAPLFDGYGWLLRTIGTVLVVSAAAWLGRRLRLPAPALPFIGLLALAAWVLLVFARGTLLSGVLPGRDTLQLFGTLLGDAFLDIDELGPPVPTNPGLVLLAVLGVGAITIVVDTVAVVLRRSAIAGLPLLLLFAVPSSVLPGGAGFLPFVLGAAGWLGLLLADSGERVARWGTPLAPSRRSAGSDEAAQSQVGRRIGAAALGIAVIVPALVPGLDARLLGGGDGSGFGGSRKVTTYNPLTRLAGQLQQDDPALPLLRYRTTATDPGYLRLTTLDEYDADSGWSSSDLSGKASKDRVEQGIPDPVGLVEADTGRTREVTIDLQDRLEGTWLPLPFPVASVDIPGPWIWDAEADTAFSGRVKLSEVDEPYTARVRLIEPDADLLRRPQQVPEEIAEVYAASAELTGPVREILQDVTGGVDNGYDKVVALQTYFGKNPDFRYDTNASAPRIDSADALQTFLEKKRGYCEQYASAMAALVRGLGLPARVAVGFTAGSRTTPDGDYLVTTSDAHAWPEVWFTGAGWVRFEPTPRTDQDLSVPAYSVSEPVQEPEAGASAAPSVDPATGQVPDQGPAAAERANESPLADGAQQPGPGVPVWLWSLPVLLLLAATPAGLAALRRRRRLHHADARRAWEAVQEDAIDVGHRWRAADSPRTAADHLLTVQHLAPEDAAALRRIALTVERTRYGRPGATDREALPAGSDVSGTDRAAGSPAAVLRHDVALVRHALLRRAGRGTRLRAVLAPPSTLRWASSGLGGFVADSLDRFDGASSAVSHRLRRLVAR